MANPKLLSVPGLAEIKRKAPSTGSAIQRIVEYVNKLPAPTPPKMKNFGSKRVT